MRLSACTPIPTIMAANQKVRATCPALSTTSAVLTFGPGDEFHQELRRRIDRYFIRTGRRRRDSAQMYVKTAVVFGWLLTSYVLLVFFAGSWWLAVPLAISLGLAMAAVGFDIQHDGGHHAYSDRPWINRLTARSLDLLGGSSYFWARKHNAMHHSNTNITGHDDDIDLGYFGRLSPHQKRLPFHRFQQYYLWLLYGFLPLKWQLYDDFHDWVVGQIGGRSSRGPRGGILQCFSAARRFSFRLRCSHCSCIRFGLYCCFTSQHRWFKA